MAESQSCPVSPLIVLLTTRTIGKETEVVKANKNWAVSEVSEVARQTKQASFVTWMDT